MMYILYGLALLVLYVAYQLYTMFAVPGEIKEIPVISLPAALDLLVKDESFDVIIEKVFRPALAKMGVARLWNQGQWELVFGEFEQGREILNNTSKFPKQPVEDLNLKRTLLRKTLGFTNITFADGEEWRRHRSIANPAFKKAWSPETLRPCINDLFDVIKESGTTPIQVLSLFQRFSLDCLGTGLFKYSFNAVSKGNTNSYLGLYCDVKIAIFSPIYTMFPILENIVPWRQVEHQKSRKFRDFMRGIVNKRKTELTEDDDDLLSLMTKASIGEKENGIDEEELINDLCILFVAGHDTTANILTATFYYLSKNPDIQEKARHEVETVLKGERRLPTADELKDLVYINCIIKESMRICTTVSQLRRYCPDGHTLSNGFVVPKNTYINVHLWSILHDSKVYPDPYVYRPDRFKTPFGPEDTQWMVFGDGTRMCIGKNFSLMQQRVVIAQVLQNFNCLPGPKIADLKSPKLSFGLVFPVDADIIFEPIP